MKVVNFKIPKEANTICLVKEDRQPHFYKTIHQHAELQITAVLSGTGKLLLGDYIGTFKPGDLYVVGENQPHVFKSDPAYLDVHSKLISHSISIFFDCNTFREMFFRFEELEAVQAFINRAKKGLKIGGKTRELLWPKMKQLVHIEGIDRFIKFFNIIQLLAKYPEGKTLSSEIVDFNIDEKQGKRLDDVIDFTLEEYHRPITLEEVANRAAMSPSSFCRFFKESTRKTYTQFLTELRIQKARELLRDKESSILDISFQCGFNNISNFNRKFKAITQFTPSEYHKRFDSINLMR